MMGPDRRGIDDRGSRKAGQVSTFPDEVWLNIFRYLEASELSYSLALCVGALQLSNTPQLWVALLHVDFCASFTQRALMRTWLAMHRHFHPRQLYTYKRREHLLDLDVAKAELQQRGEQVREQDRKQRRVRALNFVFVRVTHLFLCICLLGSSVLLWLRLDHVVDWPFYLIFAPFFAFEAFMLACASTAFTIFFLRGSSGWSFYWNRLRGVIRWLILYTSPWEASIVLISASGVAPLLACALEGDGLLPSPCPRYLLPFAAFWLASVCFATSLLRRRSFSAGCIGSFALIWLPTVLLSVLLFLKLSTLPRLPAYAIFAPSLGTTCLLLLFVVFLVLASFWLGYRGNRDWTEYATVTLLTLLTLLLPLFLFQLAVLGYLSGRISTDLMFLPWVLWLSGLCACAFWHIFMPLAVAPSVLPIDHLTRPWRQTERDAQDMEMLLLPAGVI